MSCLKIIGRSGLLKFITIYVMSISHASFSHELDRSIDSADKTLPRKINLALDLALKKFDGRKVWLIYSIDCQRTPNHDYNSAASGQDILTLEEIISGIASAQNDRSNQTEKSNQVVSLCFENLNPNQSNDHDLVQSLGIKKSGNSSLAIILDYSLESSNPCLYSVKLQKMNQPFFRDDRPIFWLGRELTTDSFEWLASQFNRISYLKLKHQIIAAIGLHYGSEHAVDFLKQIVLNKDFLTLKEEAIHWLGHQNSFENIQFLAFIAIKPHNIQLRKKAILALSQIKDKKALAIISTLARKEKNQEIRQEAIFWLSQIATDDALKILNEIIDKDKNSAIKDYTVFAISQSPAGKATPILYHIAQSNPDAQVRKKAKFWLDRTRSQRMMDFFKELVEDDDQGGSN